MEDVRLFIDWLMNSFRLLYNFFTQQHPAVQAVVFLPIAGLVLSIFLGVAKFFNGRSL